MRSATSAAAATLALLAAVALSGCAGSDGPSENELSAPVGPAADVLNDVSRLGDAMVAYIQAGRGAPDGIHLVDAAYQAVVDSMPPPASDRSRTDLDDDGFLLCFDNLETNAWADYRYTFRPPAVAGGTVSDSHITTRSGVHDTAADLREDDCPHDAR